MIPSLKGHEMLFDKLQATGKLSPHKWLYYIHVAAGLWPVAQATMERQILHLCHKAVENSTVTDIMIL